MSTSRRIKFAVLASILLGGCVAASAEDRPFTEGPVVNIASIRTEYGKFDEYMAYLGTTWKKYQEAAKKAGYILDYKVMLAEPRSEKDPDVYLMITYKNWAALDDATKKGDAITAQVEGNNATANRNATDRGKVRTVLGSQTVQELVLK